MIPRILSVQLIRPIEPAAVRRMLSMRAAVMDEGGSDKGAGEVIRGKGGLEEGTC